MKKILLLYIAILAATYSSAQLSGQLGQYKLLPQRVYANPAFMPQAKVNVALPALGKVYVENDNNWLNPSGAVERDGTGSLVFSPEAILSSIDGDHATTGLTASVEIAHVGVRFGKHYIHVRAAERAQARLSLPVDIFRLAVYGNTGSYNFEDNTANFSDLSLDAIHFREYAAGFSTQITPQINAGVAVKYLYGMEVIQTEESSLRLRTDPNTYVLTSSGRYAVNTSGIYSAVSDDGEDLSVSEYLLGKRNNGFGFDLGGTYNPIEKLEIQISAHDIGFIKWRDDIANYASEDASFVYDGVDLSEFLFTEDVDFGAEFEEEADSLLQELEEIYDFDRTQGEFNTGLNGFMRYGAAYTLMETNKHEGTAWMNIVHGLGESIIPFQASLGYNQNLWNVLQAGLHVSKRADLPITLGGGLSVNAGFFQIYALVENWRVSSVTKVTVVDENDPGSQTELFLPSSPLDLRVQFGVNLTFNRDYGRQKGTRRSMLR